MRVLLIEYEKQIIDEIKMVLEAEKYSVDITCDGEEGFNMASKNYYDVILISLILPKKDGFSVIQELRNKHVFTAILSLAGNDSSVEDRIKSFNRGGDDCLCKPFDSRELLARVEGLIRRNRRETRGYSLSFSDLRLDPLVKKVWRAGKEIKLTHTEFSLLEFLMQNPNVLLTRDYIAEKVWNGKNPSSFSNVINVYISYLRNKIDRDFNPGLIQTIRGKGYIFGAETV